MLDASCGPSFSLWVLSHGPALGQTCRYSSDGCACMHWLSNKTEQFSRLFLCVYRNRSYFFAHFSLFSMLRSKILSASKCVASSRIYCRMSLVSSALSHWGNLACLISWGVTVKALKWRRLWNLNEGLCLCDCWYQTEAWLSLQINYMITESAPVRSGSVVYFPNSANTQNRTCAGPESQQWSLSVNDSSIVIWWLSPTWGGSSITAHCCCGWMLNEEGESGTGLELKGCRSKAGNSSWGDGLALLANAGLHRHHLHGRISRPEELYFLYGRQISHWYSAKASLWTHTSSGQL